MALSILLLKLSNCVLIKITLHRFNKFFDIFFHRFTRLCYRSSIFKFRKFLFSVLEFWSAESCFSVILHFLKMLFRVAYTVKMGYIVTYWILGYIFFMRKYHMIFYIYCRHDERVSYRGIWLNRNKIKTDLLSLIYFYFKIFILSFISFISL